MSVGLMAVIRLSSVEIVRLYIYKELAGSASNSIASSWSRDRYSNNLGFNDVISDRREYRIILSIL